MCKACGIGPGSKGSIEGDQIDSVMPCLKQTALTAHEILNKVLVIANQISLERLKRHLNYWVHQERYARVKTEQGVRYYRRLGCCGRRPGRFTRPTATPRRS